MKTGVINAIHFVSDIEPGLDQLEVELNDFSTYTLFGSYSQYIDYVGKEVDFDVRKDVVRGVVTEVICSIAVKSIVQSVDDGSYVDEINSRSLIPETSKFVNVITFDKNTLKSEDVALAQIVLVVGYKDGKSKISKWKDFSCLDVNSQVFNLRLFTNSDDVDDFCKNVQGKYAMVDIKNTSYGFQVFKDMQVYEGEVQTPPEVFLSSLKLSSCYSSDAELEEYLNKYDMINILKKTMYFEPGYHIVEMAAEIILIQAICKIFEGYDRKLLYRAVFASRGYLLGSNTNLSNPLVNYHRIITSSLKNDFKLIRLLDFTGGVEEGDLNKQAYLSIRRQVTSIMKGRRGINEENPLNIAINSIDSDYCGLFQRGLVGLD